MGDDQEKAGFALNIHPGSLEVYERALSQEEIEALFTEAPDVGVPDDGEWHDVKATFRNGEVQAVHVDGGMEYATSEYLQSRRGEGDGGR